jgi:hypothetical protein
MTVPGVLENLEKIIRRAGADKDYLVNTILKMLNNNRK